MRKIILDTDIGTDIDDSLALLLAMKSKEIKLEGITTVYGNVSLRSRIVLKVLKLAGLEGIPVAKGIDKPLLREGKIFWTGHEGEEILTPEDEILEPSQMHAVDLIISKIMSMKSEITLIAIGPLTNIATAIIKEPRIVENVKEVIIMGGVTRLFNGFNLPYIEHNIRCDPEAAKIIFNSGMPITMVPLDVTMKVTINRQDLKRISQVNTPLTDTIVKATELYLKFVNRDYTWLHDPLAVSVSIDRSLVEMMNMKILVETRGEVSRGQTIAVPAISEETNVKVCIDVDVERFKDLFMETVCSP